MNKGEVNKEDYTSYLKLCKRINNSKRPYLVLNELQCKHVPSSPTRGLSMFRELALKLDKYANNGRVLVIGFAETATAIGATVASSLMCDYLTTTRENIGDDVIYFSEEHSHATEQKLFKFDTSRYDYIIFVEDEVTTGNTIMNIVNKLSKLDTNLQYVVASIYNGMSSENSLMFSIHGIEVVYLCKIDNSTFDSRVCDIKCDGSTLDVHRCLPDHTFISKLPNVRVGANMIDYTNAIDSIFTGLGMFCNVPDNVLILGTEELMYPAIMLGAMYEHVGHNVVCHSTTRSPICVVSESTDESYPLHSAYKLPSVYDENRLTYIYNVGTYDHVIIVSDCDAGSVGLKCLILVLRLMGNSDITFVKV